MSEMYNALSAVPALTDVIPDSCLSYFEQASFIAEYANDEYNNFIKDIGVNELVTFESTNALIVYEGEALDSLKEKVKNVFAKTFGAIKTMYATVYKKTDDRVINAKLYAKADNLIKDLPADAKLGKTHEFFDPKKINFAKNAAKFGKEVDKVFSKLAGSPKEDVMKAKEMLSEKMISYITGVDGIASVSKMKKALKTELVGKEIEVDKEFLTKNFKAMKDVVLGYTSEANIMAAYNQQKNAINSMFDAIEKCDSKEFGNVIPIWTGLIEDAIIVSNYAYAAMFDVSMRMAREYRTIFAKLIAKTAGSKVKSAIDKKDESVKEEASVVDDVEVPVEESSYTVQYNMVNSALDF